MPESAYPSQTTRCDSQRCRRGFGLAPTDPAERTEVNRGAGQPGLAVGGEHEHDTIACRGALRDPPSGEQGLVVGVGVQ